MTIGSRVLIPQTPVQVIGCADERQVREGLRKAAQMLATGFQLFRIAKTHIMLGLCHNACMAGYTAYFLTCMEMVEMLIKAKQSKRLKNKLTTNRKLPV